MKNLLNITLFFLSLSISPSLQGYKPKIEKLRMDERSVFLKNFLTNFFPEKEDEDIQQIITCIGDYESMGHDAATGIFKYQMGYTYAEKIIALSHIGTEFRNMAYHMTRCQDQYQRQKEELENAESHFVHSTTVDRHGHSLILNENDISKELTKCFHSYNVRQYSAFAESLGKLASQFKDNPGPQNDLDLDDINLFTMLDSICSSYTANHGDPKVVFMNVAGLGKGFFKAINGTLKENVEILTKDDIINIKHVIADEFKKIFKHIYENIKDQDIPDKKWVEALVECYEGDQMKSNHVIEGIMKNSLNYLVQGDYTMAARFMMGTFVGPCKRPDEFSFNRRVTQ